MWQGLLFAALLVAGTRAAFHPSRPAPIGWGGRFGKRFVLASTNSLDSVATPQELTVKEIFGITPQNVLYFTANEDSTISCNQKNEVRWCLEATGTETGHVVRINHCTGRPTQKWKWLPSGPMQVEGTNQCIHVKDSNGLIRAPVELGECASKATKLWAFEDAVSSPTRSSLQFPVFSHSSIGVVAMAALGLGAWLWWRRNEARMVAAGKGTVSMNMDHGGICLNGPAAMRLGDVPLTACMGANTPQVMSSGRPRRCYPNRLVMKLPWAKDEPTANSIIGPISAEDTDAVDKRSDQVQNTTDAEPFRCQP